MRHVIIGSGVTGIAAVEAIRSQDKICEIIMFSDDPHGFYSRPGLAYYLTGELPHDALFPRAREDYSHLNIKFYKGRVTKILRAEKSVEVDGKSRVAYDKLLIAAGSSAMPLKVPGADLEGVVKLDHFDDARHILKVAKRGKTAVVVGGGITALELTEGLLARGANVHYLLRGNRYWSNVLDEHESRIVERRLQEEGVTLHFNTDLVEILGKEKVSGIRMKDGSTMRCNVVAYAIGIVPRVTLAREAGLSVERGILVNEYMKTDDENILAAGDVAQVHDPSTGKSVIDSLWPVAREQGRTAGLNMVGKKEPYLRSAPLNVTRLAGLTTTIIGAVGSGQDEDVMGIARGDSETWRQLPDAIVTQSGFDVNHVRLVVGSKILLGAVVMGDQTLSVPLQKLIEEEVDISSIRQKLLARDAKIADLLMDFWSHYHKIQSVAN